MEENGVTSKLKHRKARNSILSRRFGYKKIGGNGRDSRIMRESWHLWKKKMKEIREKSILFRVSEGSSYRESTVSSYRSVKDEHVINGVFYFTFFFHVLNCEKNQKRANKKRKGWVRCEIK